MGTSFVSGVPSSNPGGGEIFQEALNVKEKALQCVDWFTLIRVCESVENFDVNKKRSAERQKGREILRLTGTEIERKVA